jgi:hypothetical protein
MSTLFSKTLSALLALGSVFFGFCSLVFFALVGEEEDWVIMIILGLFCLGLGALTAWGAFKAFKTRPPGESDDDKSRRILAIARRNGGQITAMSAVIDAKLDIDESKALLDAFVSKGIAVLEVSDEGGLIYSFPDLRPAPRA